MDLDFSSLWSWTVPLWGLFLIVLFLVGVLSEPVLLRTYESTGSQGGQGSQGSQGGGNRKQRVRFSLPLSK